MPSIYNPYARSESAPSPESTTPWWVWFVGGAVAVGLGTAGALWYAASNEAPAKVQPTANPIDPTIAAPKLVELRFDSLPTGGVYADGRSAELCRTPCTFNVDLTDGAPTELRTFVVRADGYLDAKVDVDFTKAQRDFSVSLIRTQLPPPPAAPVVVDMTVGAEPEPPAHEHVDKGSAKKSSHRNRDKKSEDKKSVKGDGKVTEPVADKPPEESKPVAPPITVDPIAPVDKTPAPKKPAGRIDPSDTIDPFRRPN
jgi:hypothetical protein